MALRNKHFKRSLIKFLVDSWQEDFAVDIIKGKIIFVTCEEKCFSYRAIDGRIYKTEEEHMQSTHEEADSRMIFHIMATPPGSSVVIRTIDTDVLIIILANMSKIDPSLRIWMEVGQHTKSNLRYINVNQLFNDYGTSICEALPGFHAFTGCDYTSAFSRKGKVRPFKMLQKNEDAQMMFATLGKEDRITEQNLKIAERFVCEIYGKKNFDSIDEVRLDIFLNKYKPKKSGTPITCVKKMDGSSFPPCSRVIREKLKRTNYICSLWLHAFQAYPPQFSPEDCGWTLKNETYDIKWFEGDISPTTVEDICQSMESENLDEEKLSDVETSDHDSDDNIYDSDDFYNEDD